MPPSDHVSNACLEMYCSLRYSIKMPIIVNWHFVLLTSDKNENENGDEEKDEDDDDDDEEERTSTTMTMMMIMMLMVMVVGVIIVSFGPQMGPKSVFELLASLQVLA